MTFRLVILTAMAAVVRAGYINGGGGHGGGLLRGGSPSYSSGYGYPVVTGRDFSSGVSGPLVLRAGYGSPYPYGGRNLPGGVPAYGARSLSYPSSSSYSYSPSPILKSGGGGYAAGFSNGFNAGGYPASNIQNYGRQSVGYTAAPIPHNPHGSFNGLGTGYGF